MKLAPIAGGLFVSALNVINTFELLPLPGAVVTAFEFLTNVLVGLLLPAVVSNQSNEFNMSVNWGAISGFNLAHPPEVALGCDIVQPPCLGLSSALLQI